MAEQRTIEQKGMQTGKSERGVKEREAHDDRTSNPRLCPHGMTLETGCMYCKVVSAWEHEIDESRRLRVMVDHLFDVHHCNCEIGRPADETYSAPVDEPGKFEFWGGGGGKPSC